MSLRRQLIVGSHLGAIPVLPERSCLGATVHLESRQLAPGTISSLGQLAKAARTRALTASQSRVLRCPITFNSERWAVSTYVRKHDSARSPADRQSRRT